MEKHITSDLNKLLIGSNWYCEPLDMFIQYVKYMYNLLNAIINKEDTVETKYSAFEVNHINMFLTQKEIVNIEIPNGKNKLIFPPNPTLASGLKKSLTEKSIEKEFILVNNFSELDSVSIDASSK